MKMVLRIRWRRRGRILLILMRRFWWLILRLSLWWIWRWSLILCEGGDFVVYSYLFGIFYFWWGFYGWVLGWLGFGGWGGWRLFFVSR